MSSDFQLIKIIETDCCYSIAFSPDSNYLLLGSEREIKFIKISNYE